jgi:hypothetical protein
VYFTVKNTAYVSCYGDDGNHGKMSVLNTEISGYVQISMAISDKDRGVLRLSSRGRVTKMFSSTQAQNV